MTEWQLENLWSTKNNSAVWKHVQRSQTRSNNNHDVPHVHHYNCDDDFLITFCSCVQVPKSQRVLVLVKYGSTCIQVFWLHFRSGRKKRLSKMFTVCPPSIDSRTCLYSGPMTCICSCSSPPTTHQCRSSGRSSCISVSWWPAAFVSLPDLGRTIVILLFCFLQAADCRLGLVGELHKCRQVRPGCRVILALEYDEV